MPAGVRAYWALGPSPLGADVQKDPTRALVESALRGIALYSFEGPARRTTLMEALLSSGILARQPYRAFLLKIHAAETPESAAHAPLPPIDTFAAILELRGCAAPDDVTDLISKSLGRSGASETTEKLAQGELHRFRPAADPDATETSWLSIGPDLLVGFGKDAIRSFLVARDAEADPAAAAYRSAIDRSRPAGDRFFEAFVNLDELRREVPDEMGWGRCARLMNAWGVANARGVMISGRLARTGDAEGPRMLLLDSAFDDRSEPFGKIRARAITDAVLPAGISRGGAPGYALVFHPDWDDLLMRAVRTYEALAPATPAQSQRLRTWLQSHDAALERLASKLGPDLLVQSGEKAGLNLGVSIRSIAGLTGDLRAVLDSLSPTIAFDPSTQLWRLRLLPAEQDHDHAMQSFTFGLTPTGIVGAWDPAPVREAVRPRRQP